MEGLPTGSPLNRLESLPTGSSLSSLATGSTPENVTIEFITENVSAPPLTGAVLGLFLCLLILVSVIGNCLVCVAVYTDCNLRKLSNLFLVSLATADLLVACLVMPFALANDIMEEWIFGSTFCKIWISFDVMCATASILNLCAISVDRYIRIKDPLQYTEWITRRSVPICICTIWAISSLISFLPISLDLHKKNANTQRMIREESSEEAPGNIQQGYCSLDFNPIYSITSSFISFLLPCLVMVAIYIKLWAIGHKHMVSIKASSNLARAVELRLAGRTVTTERSRSIFSKMGSTERPEAHYLASSNINQNLLEEHKASITVGVIVGVFLLCWTPFFVVNIVGPFCKGCVPPSVFKVLTWLGYSNSAFNPIIYSIFNSQFREGFRRILFERSFCCRSQDAYFVPHAQRTPF